MLDVKNLEHRWLKYKIKRYLPYALGFILLTVLVTGIVMWISSSDPVQPELNKQDTNLSSALLTSSNSSSVTQQAVVNANSTLLEPSMNFIQTMDTEEADAPSSANESPVKSSVMSAPPPVNKVLQLPNNEADVQAPTIKPSAKTIYESKTLSINRNESKVDIGELQKRFKETSNPNLGLFIARNAYERGDYTEAYNYALKTNAINSHLDESWLIFAKSLVKIGKTDQAKKTLQVYISDSNSDSARGLLDSIERGIFK